MRRIAVVFSILGLILAFPGVASADHKPPAFDPLPQQTTGLNQGGIEGVEFEMVESFFTGNPHTDIEFFSRDGVTYVSAGTLGVGPNNAGQNIFKLTDDSGNVSPENIEYVSGHPSATCLADESAALGLQHDVEATPKGKDVPILTNISEQEEAQLGDTQLLIDATDSYGRCHDGGDFGIINAPQGGLEIIDVTDPENPVEIALTSHIGEAHTVNVDPLRPHIAYVVTSDAVSTRVDADDIDKDGDKEELIRDNEIEGDNDALDLDGFEVVDLSSCLTAPYGTMDKGLTTEEKRDACQPEVYRYRYPTLQMALGHKIQTAVYGCHELELWPEDEMTCGSGAALIRFDMSGAFTKDGTPKGERLDCRRRESSTTPQPGLDGIKTGAMVTDCVVGEGGKDLSVPDWLKDGAPSLEGVEYLGSVHHRGRAGNGEDVVMPEFPAKRDIDFNHEAEYTRSRNFILATDERGGGIVPGGASCFEAGSLDNPAGNGGIHAYEVDELTEGINKVPSTKKAYEAYARTPEGDKAIFRAPINTQPQATECTAHVFQQVPAEGTKKMGRIFMGWYSQGTQVVDYKENADGTFEFAHVGYFIPELANQWVSHVFASEKLDDGRIAYYGVAADFAVGNGRNSVEVYKATLPAIGVAHKTQNRNNNNGGGNGDGDGNGGPGGGVGDTGADRTLPATGGGLVPLGLALVGAAALIGRRRRSVEADVATDETGSA